MNSHAIKYLLILWNRNKNKRLRCLNVKVNSTHIKSTSWPIPPKHEKKQQLSEKNNDTNRPFSENHKIQTNIQEYNMNKPNLTYEN